MLVNGFIVLSFYYWDIPQIVTKQECALGQDAKRVSYEDFFIKIYEICKENYECYNGVVGYHPNISLTLRGRLESMVQNVHGCLIIINIKYEGGGICRFNI